MLEQTRGNGGLEFAKMAQIMLKTKNLQEAAVAANENLTVSLRTKSFLKAASEFGSTSDIGFAKPLTDFRQIEKGFVESLSEHSVYDRLLTDGAMLKLPLNVRITSIATIANAFEIPEGQAMPLTEMTVDGLNLEAKKVSSMIVISNELARMGSDVAIRFLSNELLKATGQATDRTFLNDLLANVSPVTSSGSTAAAVAADVRVLLNAVNLKTGSKPYLICDSKTAGELATMTDLDGQPVFPLVGPTGGTLFNLSLLVSNLLERNSDGGTLVLVDAARIAGNHEAVLLDSSENSVLQMSTTPAEPANADTVLHSLWQNGQRAIVALRYFGFQLIDTNAVAVVDGVDY